MLVAFCALMTPGAITGFLWHEWLGLAFIPLLIVHIVLAWGWIEKTWRRLRLETHPKARLNFLLNSALALLMIVVVASGLVISEFALPSMGLSPLASRRWMQLHNLSSSYVLVLAGLHLGLNWSWIAGAWRRYGFSVRRKQLDNAARQ